MNTLTIEIESIYEDCDTCGTNFEEGGFVKINDELMHKQESAIGAERKSKIGTGDRSEKIRTYNYPQNRITDHRIGYTSMNLDRVMDGDMEDLIEALINEDQKKKLEGSI